MTTPCRSWWRNCALEADAEILEIDAMKDRLGPLDPGATRVRELISSLEMCHHKADRWVDHLVDAIGAGETQKGLGTRSPGCEHPVESVWRSAVAALSAWCAGSPAGGVDLVVSTVPASRLLAGLGERSPLKEWQVQRVIEKIRSLIGWPRSAASWAETAADAPAAGYEWLLLDPGDYEVGYRSECPERYSEHEDFWLQTVRTILHDTESGAEARLSLGLAIDMLWPCHWDFVTNLQIVLEAIGGNLRPERPFAACGRNIALRSDDEEARRRTETVCATLRAFAGDGGGAVDPDRPVDRGILDRLGEPTDMKRWLVRSLAKTSRLQMSPPPEMRAASLLEGPAWIRR